MDCKRSLILGVASAGVAGAILSYGCGDDSGGGSGKLLMDPNQADALAHQAILSDRDLPGSGWQVSKTDQFHDTGPTPDTAACKDIAARVKTAHDKEASTRAARAEKEYSKVGGDIPLTVEVQVAVFKDTSTPQDLINQFKDAVKSTNWLTCLDDSIKGGAPSDLKVSSKSVTPLGSAPSGGSAVAYEFTLSTGGQNFTLRQETYQWTNSNTGSQVTVSGNGSEVTRDIIKAAVDKTVANLAAVGKK